MKTNILNASNRSRKVTAGIVVLALGALTGFSQPFADPTTNVWDCVMSGARDGVAQFSFNPDGSFDVDEIIVPKVTKPSNDPRGVTSTDRVSDGSATGKPTTHIFGHGIESGRWGFDLKGRIIGFFSEIVNGDNCTTNTVVTSSEVINDQGQTVTSYSTNVVINCDGVTNTLSFVGVVKSGKRISLVASTPIGKVVCKGVPQVPLTALDGTTWYGAKLQGKLTVNEFFKLTSGVLPNTYIIEGEGPAYTYGGFCMVSSQKKIGFVMSIDSSQLLRAVVGKFNPAQLTAGTTGVEGEGGATLTNKIRFTAVGNAAAP
ncbi:MAG: hypothetical protein HOP33_08875 [Verrucomicrobia bacterium]|nr:hypothetical protein [Verrucomicrobiota bacterium]